MTNIRTRVRSKGDIVTEQTSPEHDGEFIVETPGTKLRFPLKVQGNNFSSTTVQELYFANNIAVVSGSSVYISFSGSLDSGLNDISVSGTIATDINNLREFDSLFSASVAADVNELRDLDTAFSSSTASDINSLRDYDLLLSTSVASDVNELRDYTTLLSETIDSNYNIFVSVSSSIAADITSVNDSLVYLSSSLFALSASAEMIDTPLYSGYREISTSSLFPTLDTWWNSSDKDYKLLETEYTRNVFNRPTLIVRTLYTNGTASLVVSESITYNRLREINRTRTVHNA